MATIRERNGKYQVRYRINNKETSKTFKSQREANKFKKEIEAELTLGIAKDDSDITFSKYAAEFMEIHAIDLKETTKKNYNQYIKLINKRFGNSKIIDMTPHELDKYFLYLLKIKKLKMNTIKKYRDVLKLILKDAYKKDIIQSNPIDKLAFKFTTQEEYNNKFVDYRDFKLILDSFEMEYYKHFMLLGYYTGMRKGEILALTWDDVDFDNRLIYVSKSLNSFGQVTTPKTKKSIRSIYIHDKLYELLHEILYYQEHNKDLLLDEYNDNNLVICKDDGSYLNTMTVSKTFNEKKKLYGVNITPHMLRHTFATLANEVNDFDLPALLGHNSKAMTTHYQHHQNYSDDTKRKLNSIF